MIEMPTIDAGLPKLVTAPSAIPTTKKIISRVQAQPFPFHSPQDTRRAAKPIMISTGPTMRNTKGSKSDIIGGVPPGRIPGKLRERSPARGANASNAPPEIKHRPAPINSRTARIVIPVGLSFKTNRLFGSVPNKSNSCYPFTNVGTVICVGSQSSSLPAR